MNHFTEWSLRGYSAKHEVCIRNHDRLATVMTIHISLDNPRNVFVIHFTVLVPDIGTHGMIVLCRVNQLYKAFALFRLLVCQYPKVSVDARAVELPSAELDYTVKVIILQNPSADIGRSTAGLACKKRGGRQNNANLAAAFLCWTHLGNCIL